MNDLHSEKGLYATITKQSREIESLRTQLAEAERERECIWFKNYLAMATTSCNGPMQNGPAQNYCPHCGGKILLVHP